MIWISGWTFNLNYAFRKYNGCFLDASYYLLAAAEGSTHNYLAGNLHQIAPMGASWVLPSVTSSSGHSVIVFFFLPGKTWAGIQFEPFANISTPLTRKWKLVPLIKGSSTNSKVLKMNNNESKTTKMGSKYYMKTHENRL